MARGPYKLDEFTVDQRVVVSRADNWPDLDKRMPRVAIWQQIKEPQQRVTALLNNEVQIARLIPPQLLSQVEHHPDVTVDKTGSVELMFIALNPTFKPWDDVRVRQAASHAIDRDLIIKKLLNGLADRLDGPLGPNRSATPVRSRTPTNTTPISRASSSPRPATRTADRRSISPPPMGATSPMSRCRRR